MKKNKSLNLALILAVILIAISGFVFFQPTAYNSSEMMKPYYSGDAVSYNGRIFFASTNMGGVEIFELAGGRIDLINKFSSYDSIRYGDPDFNSAMFKIENGKLFIYLTDGKYIYKYILSDAGNPSLVGQVMDNSWDWFVSLARCGDNFISQGAKGLKIWNSDLNVIYSNDMTNPEPGNIQMDDSCELAFSINGGDIGIFNRFANRNLPPIKISAEENHFRKILFSSGDSSFYAVDDSSVKQFDYEGKVLRSFNHTSGKGYDAAESYDGRYIYFSDGIGVVKLSKKSFQPEKWAYTADLGGKGGWAMRIFPVKGGDGEKLIVFNNGNILALDENLEKIDSYASNELDDLHTGLARIEANKKMASIGTPIRVSGQGFFPHEDVKISLADSYIYILADDYGKFRRVIETPAAPFGIHEITAEGFASKRTDSISFSIIR